MGKTIFLASLSAEARMGRIEFLRCRAQNGNSFRTVVATTRIDQFRSQLAEGIDLAREHPVVKVRTVQDRFYPKREKGTWFVALHLLQRLAYLGFMIQTDNWSFRVPELLLNAKTKIDGTFITPDPARLA